jgi:cytoskeletal protein CcmA (bactofilin family)
MWSDRTKDSFAGRSSAPNNNPAPVVDTGAGVGPLAVIGRGMVIKGDITSKESLRIDGEVDGSLDLFDCQLTVGREGRVGANASAREIELLGTVRGNLEATSKITIRKGARLIGDLRAPGILIEEGAYVKGKIEIINTDEPAEINATQPAIKQQAAGS